MAKGSELAVREEYPALVSIEDIREQLYENFGAAGLQPGDLPRIKIPGAGATVWTIPSLEGEDIEKSITGIILKLQPGRVYFEGEFTGMGQRPACTSPDAITGYGDIWPANEAGVHCNSCATCPFAQWGSNPKTGGMACQERANLFFLRRGERIPYVISLPITSIKPMREYSSQLFKSGKTLSRVETRLELERVQSRTGIAYAKIKPVFSKDLDAEGISQLREFMAVVGTAIAGAGINEDDPVPVVAKIATPQPFAA